MKPNPGGILQVADIVGRDQLIADLTTTLAEQSVLLIAERRTGKTHVLEKFNASPPANWIIIKRDIGSVRTPTEFVQQVMADLHPHLGAGAAFKSWLKTIGEQAGGAQIGPVKLPNFPSKNWKQVLTDTISHLDDIEAIDKVVFLWDEIPWMLEAIAQNDPKEAMELLDTLRALRQQHPKTVRMVFTGSLGLHHIVRNLKAQGYKNTPVNDMLPVEVEPLALQHAEGLVARLFTDGGLKPNALTLFRHTAQAVDCVPFYIHHVMSALLKEPSLRARAVTEDDIEAIVGRGIYSTDNPWDLQHYEERTQSYYGDQRGACLALLDAVATSAQPIAMEAAVRRAQASFPNVDSQQWLELSRLLQRDHYFHRNDANEFSFKFNVVKRWWTWHRNLKVI